MADVGKVYGVAIADLSKVCGVAVADLAKIVGLDVVVGSVKGYIAGGQEASRTTEVDRLVFATDTTTADGADLSTATDGAASIGSNSASIYTLGGQDTGGYTDVVYEHRVSDDTITTKAATLTTARQNAYAMSERTTKGFVIGGYNGSGRGTADKLTFATDAVAGTSSADRVAADFNGAGSYANSTFGYACGGSAAKQRVEKTTWSTDTTSLVGASTLTADRQTVTVGAPSNAAGLVYVSGNSAGPANTIEYMNASSDTASSIASTMSLGRYIHGGMSQGTIKGYWIAGYTGAANVATADLITWSTESVSATASADRASGTARGCGMASDVGF